MNIENEIWKKCQINDDALTTYGFQKKGSTYFFQKNIFKNTFRVEIQIREDGTIKGTVYDIEFGSEYTNYRREGDLGAFASQVKEEFINLLLDIKKNCTYSRPFTTPQANRLASLIYELYQDTPEFPWEGEPHGVFRNPNNQKWYGLIMSINKKKLDGENREVEILNVKLAKEKIDSLVKKKGFYPAYHMNKKNWITLLLDDTLSDEEVMECLEESYQYTEEKKEWLIPSNPHYYDVESAFQKEDVILWKQPRNIHLNDIVYLYVGQPYSAIFYQCQVIELNIPYSYKSKQLSMTTVMRIQLLKKYPKTAFPLEKLKTYGVTTVRGPRFVPSKLAKELKKKVL